MKQTLPTKYSFTPKKATIDFIKQFAYTYRTILSDGHRYVYCLN